MVPTDPVDLKDVATSCSPHLGDDDCDRWVDWDGGSHVTGQDRKADTSGPLGATEIQIVSTVQGRGKEAVR